jgi:hypothetical protein
MTDAQDEELVTGGRYRGPWWWLLAALVVAGVVLWSVTRPSPPSKHADAPAPAASSQASPACSGVPDCTVLGGVSPAIDRLVRTYLPHGVRMSARTVVSRSPLTHENQFVAREIDAFVDSATVLIRVQRGGSETQLIMPDPPGVGSLLLHQVNSGLVVRLQYLAPDTVPPLVERLRALMADPRLVSM